MTDNPVPEVNLSTVVALLAEIDQRMREGLQTLSKRVEDGFAAAAREQQALRENLQTLSKRVEDGFAAAAKEQRALREHQQLLGMRMEAGFALEAQERQALASKLEDLNRWLNKELPENAHILSRMIERGQAEFAEFKREKSVQDKDVLQRLSKLETARSLN